MSATRCFRAPGRVNLVGEHTDYNDGLVLPAAIDAHVVVELTRHGGTGLLVASEGFGPEVTLEPTSVAPRRHWTDYVAGVARELTARGLDVGGARLHIHGDLPWGAGLSSSAALSVACACALVAHAGAEVPPLELVRLCRRAENEFVGTACGIMDPFASRFGVDGHALLLDCRSLDARPVKIPEELAIVVCDTGVKHTLASGGFNERREDCRAAVRRLSEHRAGVQSLRDVGLDEIADAAPRLGPRLLRRVRHVVGENARVLDTVAALEAGDLRAVGTAMAASHDSLRLDYEVSCPELDLLVDLTRPLAGVVGTRMTGGGFGGSTVSLVHRDAVPDLLGAVTSGYRDATGRVVRTFVTRPVAGASELRSS